MALLGKCLALASDLLQWRLLLKGNAPILAAVTLAVATGGKDTAGEKTHTQLAASSSSGAREQLARFAAAGAHVGLRATGIPAVAAARLEALARARAAVDARVEEGQGAR